MQDEAVAVAAAIGVPDAVFIEQLWLFVQPEEGATVDEERVIALCKDQLAGFKVPKTIVFGPLPKTSTGKIQKFVLRDRARTGDLESLSE